MQPCVLRAPRKTFLTSEKPWWTVGSAELSPYLVLWGRKGPKALLLPDIPCGNHCANDSFPNIHTKCYGMGGNLHGLCMVISLPVFAQLLRSFVYLKALEAPANNSKKTLIFLCLNSSRDIMSREVSVCECMEAWMRENVSERATWPVSDHPFPWVIIY